MFQANQLRSCANIVAEDLPSNHGFHSSQDIIWYCTNCSYIHQTMTAATGCIDTLGKSHVSKPRDQIDRFSPASQILDHLFHWGISNEGGGRGGEEQEEVRDNHSFVALK
mmetsp:Transcript_9180/g.24875  ORF Transcript_9180/g.24875 Transcript_9180/m.24875 type:complete len:110 (+) Transcript_9180:2026-2355(+)